MVTSLRVLLGAAVCTAGLGAEQCWQRSHCTHRLFAADRTELFGFCLGSQVWPTPLIVTFNLSPVDTV